MERGVNFEWKGVYVCMKRGIVVSDLHPNIHLYRVVFKQIMLSDHIKGKQLCMVVYECLCKMISLIQMLVCSLQLLSLSCYFCKCIY